MKIVVCIKQVPDTEAEVKWDLQKGTLKREDMDAITNPFDEFALEEALLTKEKYDAEIVALSMGPQKATDVLRNALALGVDEVHHVSDPALAGSDTLGDVLRPREGHREDRRRRSCPVRQTGNRRQHGRRRFRACRQARLLAADFCRKDRGDRRGKQEDQG